MNQGDAVLPDAEPGAGRVRAKSVAGGSGEGTRRAALVPSLVQTSLQVRENTDQHLNEASAGAGASARRPRNPPPSWCRGRCSTHRQQICDNAAPAPPSATDDSIPTICCAPTATTSPTSATEPGTRKSRHVPNSDQSCASSHPRSSSPDAVRTPGATRAGPADTTGTHKAAVAAAAPLQDFSSSLPRTTRDEVTGDFLGRGYAQHMRAEGGALNIYDPPALGGTLQQSTPLDLAPPPDGPIVWVHNENTGTISPWADYILASDCLGCFEAVDQTYHLRSIYLAVVGDSLYISGTKGDSIDGGDNDTFPPDGHSTYRNLLYKVPANGTCAREDCASDPSIGKVAELPTLFATTPERSVGATALAAGTSGGNPFVAVGLTDFGTLVYDGDLNGFHEYGGAPTGYQTPVSALAFDPGGSGMLSVGLLSPGAHSLTTQVNPDGTVTDTRGYLAIGGGPTLNPFPLTTTFGHKSNGSLVVAYGYNNGGVLVGDPQVLGGQALTGGTSPAGISVMDAVPRPDGGADDYAVAMQTTADVTGPLIGASWRWDESQLTFTEQKVGVDAAGNPTTILPNPRRVSPLVPRLQTGPLHGDEQLPGGSHRLVEGPTRRRLRLLVGWHLGRRRTVPERRPDPGSG